MQTGNPFFVIPDDYIKREDVNVSKLGNYRTDFMRDRDRILYSRAFRRLAGKTQIYTAGINDHQRNRMTHTLEVAQIARTVAKALNLNCDLAEAIALGHDLGHAPFGHAGEEILQEIMTLKEKTTIDDSPFNKCNTNLQDKCGFKHNIQSVRVAARIEDNYGRFGLNLTNYTLWGILNHAELCYSSSFPGEKSVGYLDSKLKSLISIEDGAEAWSFEGMIVKYADIIAQWHHDLEDALLGRALSTMEVNESLTAFLSVIMELERDKVEVLLPTSKYPDREYSTRISAIVINSLITKLINCSLYNLNQIEDWMKKENVSAESLFKQSFSDYGINGILIKQSIGFDIYDYLSLKTEGEKLEMGERNSKNKEAINTLYTLISERIHHSMDVERMNTKGQYIIRKLFEAYYANPQQLPDGAIIHFMIDVGKVQIKTEEIYYRSVQDSFDKGIGAVRADFEKVRKSKSTFDTNMKALLMRRICDHISGMTDRYAMYEYNNLY